MRDFYLEEERWMREFTRRDYQSLLEGWLSGDYEKFSESEKIALHGNNPSYFLKGDRGIAPYIVEFTGIIDHHKNGQLPAKVFLEVINPPCLSEKRTYYQINML